MKLVPGGEFNRGRTHEWSDKDLPWYPNPLKDDTPVKRIRVDSFQRNSDTDAQSRDGSRSDVPDAITTAGRPGTAASDGVSR